MNDSSTRSLQINLPPPTIATTTKLLSPQ